MSSTRFSGITVTCDAKWYNPNTDEVDGCPNMLTLAGNDRPANHGWGMVRVYDGYINANVIGDQNGWNNYDLCPEHYGEQMNFLGIQKHNIPTPSKDDDEWEALDAPVYDDRGTD